MGQLFSELRPEHEKFIKKQRMFFVASAPMDKDGHVNLSPKGYDSFRIISPNEVSYLDLTGSGNETSAHLQENGRITIMFCAFEGPPLIMRLFGKGTVILPDTPRWDELVNDFPLLPGARQIITVNIQEVKTSCGWAIPFYSYSKERETLQKWTLAKDEQELLDYQKEYNVVSMDGLPTPLGQKLFPAAGGDN
ncbi:pyridoxamine 5'-phosphate oxidase family protein [Brevibacillus sp. Leaf182]|uniref:pyridoxamine 5'-phosphate oxidase family protein n=1 Tax=Brevibacillus sp. Leaf182 TaxID=1736290 RepID=UPI0006F652AB|nr:pyridoxamine 5'-phosphate oxidase family protein [Brevibacillus sp. Leaf182]RAT95850.1 pyridoxamine 5'-phosphate oxidase family protein [Brevibacillus sp. Leaf182]